MTAAHVDSELSALAEHDSTKWALPATGWREPGGEAGAAAPETSRLTGLPTSPRKFQISAEIDWENGRYGNPDEIHGRIFE